MQNDAISPQMSSNNGCEVDKLPLMTFGQLLQWQRNFLCIPFCGNVIEWFLTVLLINMIDNAAVNRGKMCWERIGAQITILLFFPQVMTFSKNVRKSIYCLLGSWAGTKRPSLVNHHWMQNDWAMTKHKLTILITLQDSHKWEIWRDS